MAVGRRSCRCRPAEAWVRGAAADAAGRGRAGAGGHGVAAAGTPVGPADRASPLVACARPSGRWRPGALVVALAIQIGTNYANDYSRRRPGHRRRDRVGPVRLVARGLAIAGRGEAGGVRRVRRRRRGRPGAGRGRRPGGCCSVGRGVAAPPAGSTPAARALRLRRASASCSSSCSSAWWPRSGRPTCSSSRSPWLALWRAVPVGLLATALLVVNNLRDIPTDTVAGKRTLAVRLGDQRTRVLYVVLMVVPFLAACRSSPARPARSAVSLLGRPSSVAQRPVRQRARRAPRARPSSRCSAAPAGCSSSSASCSRRRPLRLG